MAFRDWCKKENPDAKAAEAGVDRLLAGAELQPAEDWMSQAEVEDDEAELWSMSDEAESEEEDGEEEGKEAAEESGDEAEEEEPDPESSGFEDDSTGSEAEVEVEAEAEAEV